MWILVAMAAPILFSASSFIDKYLLSKYFKKGGAAGALMIFSAFIGLFLLPVIYLIQPSAVQIAPYAALVIIFNGFLYVFSLVPYLYALEKSESSIVIPLFQLIPVFTYILGYLFLGEVLSFKQIIASLLIIFGAFGLSFDYGSKGLIFKKRVLGLMVFSCLLVSFNVVIFKAIAIREDFLTTSFWEYMGFALSGIFMFAFIPSYRRQFLSLIKRRTTFMVGINAFNELINIVAKIIMNFAALFIPVALVSVIGGLQPFFIFIMGAGLTVFFPNLIKENIEKKYLVQKAVSIALMFAGTLTISLK